MRRTSTEAVTVLSGHQTVFAGAAPAGFLLKSPDDHQGLPLLGGLHANSLIHHMITAISVSTSMIHLIDLQMGEEALLTPQYRLQQPCVPRLAPLHIGEMSSPLCLTHYLRITNFPIIGCCRVSAAPQHPKTSAPQLRQAPQPELSNIRVAKNILHGTLHATLPGFDAIPCSGLLPSIQALEIFHQDPSQRRHTLHLYKFWLQSI